jgi:hypothetical protein
VKPTQDWQGEQISGYKCCSSRFTTCVHELLLFNEPRIRVCKSLSDCCLMTRRRGNHARPPIAAPQPSGAAVGSLGGVEPNRRAAERLHERAVRSSAVTRGGNGSLDVHLGCCTITSSLMIKYNGGGNDQVDCCCWLCLSCRDIGASNDTRADSSVGQHGNASRLGLRAGQDKDQWCLRVQSCHPSAPQVCAMDRTHLRSVALVSL